MQVNLKQLSLETLSELDMGRVREAFNAELRRVIADLKDRPGLIKDRLIVLKFGLVPETHEQGQIETAKGRFEIASKIPPRQTREYSMGVGNGSHDALLFNDNALDDVRQQTLDQEEARCASESDGGR